MRSYGVVLWTVVNTVYLVLAVVAVSLNIANGAGAVLLFLTTCSYAGEIAWILAHDNRKDNDR